MFTINIQPILLALLVTAGYYVFLKYQRTRRQSRRHSHTNQPVPTPPPLEQIPPQELEPEPAPQQQNGVIGPEDFEFDEGFEPFDPELAARNARAPAAGNANGTNGTTRTGTKLVGKKKAASLQRKDQRRAYFEHIRQQAEFEREDRERLEMQYADLEQEERAERAERERIARQEREQERELRRARASGSNAKDGQKNNNSSGGSAANDAVDWAKGVWNSQLEEVDVPGEEERRQARKLNGKNGLFLVMDEKKVVKVGTSELQQLANQLEEKESLSFEEVAKILDEIVAQR